MSDEDLLGAALGLPPDRRADLTAALLRSLAAGPEGPPEAVAAEVEPAGARSGAARRPRVSGTPGAIRLVVQADDFGMCHAVNHGIARAFREGIVTQASMMAVCPWLPEAIALARTHGIPVGMHCTLTCEWERFRWGPLTAGATLRDADGGLWRTVEDARRAIAEDDACAELRAQAARLIRAGLDLRWFDAHMGPISPRAYAQVCALHDRPFLDAFADRSPGLDSITILGPGPGSEKLDRVLAWLGRLGPGAHVLCTHPGEPGGELGALAHEGEAHRDWAEAHRAGDLAVLCDPRVRRAIEDRGIELASVS